MFVSLSHSFQWLDYPFLKLSVLTFTFPMLQLQQLRSDGGTTYSCSAS